MASLISAYPLHRLVCMLADDPTDHEVREEIERRKVAAAKARATSTYPAIEAIIADADRRAAEFFTTRSAALDAINADPLILAWSAELARLEKPVSGDGLDGFMQVVAAIHGPDARRIADLKRFIGERRADLYRRHTKDSGVSREEAA